MRKSSLSLYWVLAALIAAPVSAADIPGKTSVAVRAGTLGMGVELGYTLPVANLSARIGWNGYGYDRRDSIEGIDYDLELDLSSVVALVDWRPWGQVTHFTAGVVLNGNEIGAVSQNSATYTVGGTTYSAADVGNLSGNVTFDRVVPYAGLGWNLPIAPKTALTFELGVVFQGAPELSLVADGLLANDPAFQAELDAETAQFVKDIEDYEYYPVVVVGLSRRF